MFALRSIKASLWLATSSLPRPLGTKRLRSVKITLAALAITSLSAASSPSAVDRLWRLDCGTMIANDASTFSDTHAFDGKKLPITDSCYLIKHGESYMIWDAGLSASFLDQKIDPNAAGGMTVRITLAAQLAKLNIKPSQITKIGISHYHYDHTGQASSFPQALLLIGKADLDAFKAGVPGVDPKALQPWITGGSKVEVVSGDKDIFSDGSVVMMDLPGHTPGHHGLLVRMSSGAIYLLSGDVVHFHENYDTNGVPTFNTSRSDSLASLDRVKGTVRNLKATLIIQHDARDINKLPKFPEFAR